MIVKGDHVYFQTPKGPRSGEVKAVGKHGATVLCEGKHHKIKHAHVLGMKQKLERKFTVVDQGGDGALVEDSEGKQLYIHDSEGHLKQALSGDVTGHKKNDQQPQALTKSFNFQNKVILFLKAGPIKNRPGLSLQEVTDNQGHITHKWKHTSEPVKAEREKQTEKEASKPNAHQNSNTRSLSAGDHVAFNAGKKAATGEIVSSGKDGITVRDEAGKEHKVFYHEIHAQIAEKPNYPQKIKDEEDKPYLKRIKHGLEDPKHLPEEHARYFNMEGSITVPIESLVSSKTDEENKQGGNNSPKYMLAAYHGQVAKRDPISVEDTGNGQYKILDGNGTYTGVKKYGWKSLPVKVVETKGNIQSWEPNGLFTQEEMNLPPTVLQKGVDSIESLYQQAEEGLTQYRKLLGGIAKEQKFKIFDDDMNAAREAMGRNEKGIFMLIAGIKGKARAAEKAQSEKHSWAGLKDIVRGTIAVDNLHELGSVLDLLRQTGMKIARRPKNRFAKPVPGGYRDLLFNVTVPNGHVCEIQINTKSMIVAKRQGHKHYAIMRPIREKAEREERALTPEETKIIERETRLSQALYVKAWQEDQRTIGVTNNMKKAMILVVRRSL